MADTGKKEPQVTSPPAPATAGPRCPPSDAANPHLQSARGGERVDAGEVAMVRRSSIAPLLVCGLCRGILRQATTVCECLHSFCGNCIYEKFKDEDNKRCPTCNIDLGCDPKLRVDRNLQGISSVIFPAKRKMEEFASLHPEFVSLPSLASQADEVYHSDAAGTSFLEYVTNILDDLKALMLNLHDRSRKKSALLALASQEVADLRTQVMEAQERAREAEDKLAGQAKRACEDAAVLQRLEGERDTARRERDDAVSLVRRNLSEKKDLESALQKAETGLAQACAEAASATRRADESSQLADERDKELAGLRKQIEELQAEVGAEKEISAGLATINQGLTRQVTGLRAKLSGRQKKLETADGTTKRLRKELEQAKKILEERDGTNGLLVSTIESVLKELQMDAAAPGAVSFERRVMEIPSRARAMASEALRRGVHEVVSIIFSHYPGLDQVVGEGWAPGYEDHRYDEIEAEVAPLAQKLAIIAEKMLAWDVQE